jgi:integrase
LPEAPTDSDNVTGNEVFESFFVPFPRLRLTPGQIRQSYRKLAKKYHPDKHKDDQEAHNKFQEIAEGALSNALAPHFSSPQFAHTWISSCRLEDVWKLSCWCPGAFAIKHSCPQHSL